MKGALFATLSLLLNIATATLRIGVGISDLTGPSVEINFMGYAVPGQRGTGIHQRLRARAFVIDDQKKRVAFVSVDGGMCSDLVKKYVITKLEEKLPGVYSNENVAISGTHSHSGPGGYLQYVLYQSTSLGFVRETFDAWVEGISSAILSADSGLVEGDIHVASGQLLDSNINRSPTSYLLNPQEERDDYPDGDTDKMMLLLKFVAKQDSKVIGVLNWFSVHATSMNNTNTLVSGDNKGRASYVLEKQINGRDALPGMGPFVAAFASTNLGDVSPNTAGPKCIDTGLPCDGTSSTCNGRCEKCIAFGPGTNGDIFESTQIIGDNQAKMASTLMDAATPQTALSASVDFRHSFVKFPGLNVTTPDGKETALCRAAMGFSFAAGTTDGPGMFNFEQSATILTPNPFWNKVRDFINKPTIEDERCQAPKPILLNTGAMERPYMWDPDTLPLQIFRIGRLFIVSVPSEFTTMSGRRLRKRIAETVKGMAELNGEEPIVTIAGLSNGYSSYVTTYEEYQGQRYEAASTIFGPNTLSGYLQELTRIAKDMATGKFPSDTGPQPEDLISSQIEMMPGVIFDRTPLGQHFGQVLVDANPQYKIGDMVSVTFRSACPRNNQHLQGTFLTIESKSANAAADSSPYIVKYTDGDWSTKFHWQAGKPDKYAFGLSAESIAIITWAIPTDAEAGIYRVCHFGDHKPATSSHVVAFTGCSSEFTVTA